MSQTQQQSTKTRRRAPEEKRASILTSAKALFRAHGFEGVSTSQIAKAAGVSEGMIFHNFGSKKGLFTQILADYARAAAAATMPDDLSELTEEYVVRSAFDFSDSHPDVHEMLMRSGSEFSEADVEQQSDIIVEVIRQKLELGAGQDKVRRGNTKIMAQLQFAVVDAAYREWRRTNDPALREDYIQEAIRCMQAMLAPSH